jgi:hypothetical protein
MEFVDYGDVGVDFDGAPIQHGRFVSPLANGVERRLIKHRVAVEELQGANCAVGADYSAELYVAFATGLTG